VQKQIVSVFAIIFLTCLSSATAATFRFIKSQSGPSGKIADNRFVFDEVRNRFVYPQDKSLTVYFEWEAPPGDYTLSAFWKDPEGRVFSISPDIKMQTKTSQLNAYWVYELANGMRNGIWTVEIRIDGEPAGAHSFELMMPEAARVDLSSKPPTLNEIYATASRSLVWIRKMDDVDRQSDTSLGFVIAAGQVVTAFQAVDSATLLEVELSKGRRVTTHELWACNRLQDWAVLKVDTGNTAALRKAESGNVPVGERYLVFNVERNQTRIFGGVDITGRRSVAGFGDRIQIQPSPSQEAVGGPLLTPDGLVAGVVGGSVAPGSRVSRHAMSVSPALWSRLNADSAATPISLVSVLNDGRSATLQSLLDSGVLTPPVTPNPSLIYGGSTRAVSKLANDLTTKDTSEFSHRDVVAWVYTLWQKKDKSGKGVVSAKVYDCRNKLLVDVIPKKVSLSSAVPTRVAFDFALQKFTAGIYRVDVLWNDKPAWRTFLTVMD